MRLYPVLLLVQIATSLFSVSALADTVLPAVASRPAVLQADVSHAMLLGGARAGTRLVAVGLHGLVILSDDNGVTWRQTPVPVSVALTDAGFASAQNGWIIGHLGVVLHTRDGGTSWVRQLDGVTAAHLALDAAQQAVSSPHAPQSALKIAQQLVADGSDKPFLAINVADSDHALVVGAYGLAFQTADAGANWRPVLDRFDDSGGWHLYGLAATGTTLYAAGEQGLFLRSVAGEPFRAVAMPASVSLFGLITTKTGRVIAYGLNGLLEYSDDQGSHWTEIRSDISNTISGGIVLADGRILIVSQIGQFLVSKDNGTSFRLLAELPAQPAAGLIQAPDGSVITLGPGGVTRVTLDKIAGNP